MYAKSMDKFCGEELISGWTWAVGIREIVRLKTISPLSGAAVTLREVDHLTLEKHLLIAQVKLYYVEDLDHGHS